jgi:uncharacterized protein YodC (DUF2158 family)
VLPCKRGGPSSEGEKQLPLECCRVKEGGPSSEGEKQLPLECCRVKEGGPSSEGEKQLPLECCRVKEGGPSSEGEKQLPLECCRVKEGKPFSGTPSSEGSVSLGGLNVPPSDIGLARAVPRPVSARNAGAAAGGAGSGVATGRHSGSMAARVVLTSCTLPSCFASKPASAPSRPKTAAAAAISGLQHSGSAWKARLVRPHSSHALA